MIRNPRPESDGTSARRKAVSDRERLILAIDQGTTGTRSLLVNARGEIVASAYRELTQHYPKPGWVEHDAEEIWDAVATTMRQVLARARVRPAQVAAVGITNQRETTVVWDRKTSRPVARAIVWQCRRTAARCEQLQRDGWQEPVRKRTGLPIDAYFSGTKLAWLLEQVRGLRARAADGRALFGTVDAWLIWKLTGGAAHRTDYTNASRTMLFDIHRRRWDPELCRELGVPAAMLPEVLPSSARFGVTAGVPGLPDGVPIGGVAGDQQAALFGQGCLDPGSIKNTYGTGCFVMMNTGTKAVASRHGLLTTLACGAGDRPDFALEGSVFVAGAAVQWLRDNLRVLDRAGDSEAIALAAGDSHGIYVIPAFTGLGAPYWDMHARGAIVGLTRGSTREHIVRATLESIAFQTRDVLDAMRRDTGLPIRELKVDGGAAANAFLMQFQADLLDARVTRPRSTETTALGAAFLAGVHVGLWRDARAAVRTARRDCTFRPRMRATEREARYRGWLEAVGRVRSS